MMSTVCGTPQYVAPEVIQGTAGTVYGPAVRTPASPSSSRWMHWPHHQLCYSSELRQPQAALALRARSQYSSNLPCQTVFTTGCRWTCGRLEWCCSSSWEATHPSGVRMSQRCLSRSGVASSALTIQSGMLSVTGEKQARTTCGDAAAVMLIPRWLTQLAKLSSKLHSPLCSEEALARAYFSLCCVSAVLRTSYRSCWL